MNPLLWLVGGYAVLAASHYLLKPSVERIWKPDPNRRTPAQEKAGTLDFEPLPQPVVAGHYYMSIAGLSPVVSAITGLYWGWLPALLWLLLGVIIMGTPTEYIHMMGSLRNGGSTFGPIVDKVIGGASGISFTVALWFLGTITYAIFMTVMAKTLVSVPMATLPTLALSVIACFYGYLRKVKGWPFWPTTIGALIVWLLFIYLGILYPIKISYEAWIVILVAYCFIAAYIPVWLLLAPRDFLNSSILWVGLAVGTVALIIGMPSFQIPSFVGFNTARGLLWPAIFATITCGALNATHCMISAGTASRQVSNEKHVYGIVSLGTKGETVVGLMAIALIATQHDYNSFTSAVIKNVGGAFSEAFGKAMAYIGLPPEVGLTFGALTLTGFVITTMDSYARGARYCLEELGTRIPTLKALRFDVPLVSTLVVIVVGLLLALKTPFMQLWAGFALVSLSVALYPYAVAVINRLQEGLPWDEHFYRWIVIPGAFINVTALAALIYFLIRFVSDGQVVAAVMNVSILLLYLVSLVQAVARIRAAQRKAQEQRGVAGQVV